ncbi:MAG: helix-turn-helix transcriptional regulator [Muribaculaceae bacterium]|nr:helix-turn-helix transcriptional regulator [Muribaculaceae bacterium]
MTSQLSAKMDRGIVVFRSLGDIPFIKFPTRLDRMLLVVCSKGEISAEIDVATRNVGSSSVMVLRPGHMIGKCNVSPDFEGFFITAEQEKLNEIFPSLHYFVPYSLHFNSNPVIGIDSNELEALKLIYNMMCRKLREGEKPFSNRALTSLCELLFYEALGIYASRTQQKPHKTRREELLADFIDVLEKNFRTQRSVNFYADKLFITPKHLSAMLKEISGQTAGEWIDRRVINEAKLMLRTTGMNIQEISSALNFSNQSFFGKYFKHLAGISPRDYRTKLSDL